MTVIQGLNKTVSDLVEKIDNYRKSFFSNEVSDRKRYRKPMRKEDYPNILQEGTTIRANGLMYVIYRKLSRGRFLMRLLTDQEVGRT